MEALFRNCRTQVGHPWRSRGIYERCIRLRLLCHTNCNEKLAVYCSVLQGCSGRAGQPRKPSEERWREGQESGGGRRYDLSLEVAISGLWLRKTTRISGIGTLQCVYGAPDLADLYQQFGGDTDDLSALALRMGLMETFSTQLIKQRPLGMTQRGQESLLSIRGGPVRKRQTLLDSPLIARKSLREQEKGGPFFKPYKANK